MYLHRWFSRNVSNQEIHRYILAVHVLVHFVPNCLWQKMGVQICVMLVNKSGACQYHR